jgi:hypothetical protein
LRVSSFDPATATDSEALPSRQERLTSLPASRSKEAVVAHREQKPTPTLEVSIMFEPCRLAPACVARAYERVLPRVRRTIATAANLKNERQQRPSALQDWHSAGGGQ